MGLFSSLGRNIRRFTNKHLKPLVRPVAGIIVSNLTGGIIPATALLKAPSAQIVSVPRTVSATTFVNAQGQPISSKGQVIIGTTTVRPKVTVLALPDFGEAIKNPAVLIGGALLLALVLKVS